MKLRHGHGLWLHISEWEGYKNWRDYGEAFTPKNIIKTDGRFPEGDTLPLSLYHDWQDADWSAGQGVRYFPLVPKYRVKGQTYQPYSPVTNWAREANQMMSDLAQSNFINRRR